MIILKIIQKMSLKLLKYKLEIKKEGNESHLKKEGFFYLRLRK